MKNTLKTFPNFIDFDTPADFEPVVIQWKHDFEAELRERLKQAQAREWIPISYENLLEEILGSEMDEVQDYSSMIPSDIQVCPHCDKEILGE